MSSNKRGHSIGQESAPSLRDEEVTSDGIDLDAPSGRGNALVDNKFVLELELDLDMIPAQDEPVADHVKVTSNDIFRDIPADEFMRLATIYSLPSDLPSNLPTHTYDSSSHAITFALHCTQEVMDVF
ncbi:hypothetical protein ACMFMG_000662 [Clarireedia jacksonii]